MNTCSISRIALGGYIITYSALYRQYIEPGGGSGWYCTLDGSEASDEDDDEDTVVRLDDE